MEFGKPEEKEKLNDLWKSLQFDSVELTSATEIFHNLIIEHRDSSTEYQASKSNNYSTIGQVERRMKAIALAHQRTRPRIVLVQE